MSIAEPTADDKVPVERGCAGLVVGFTAFGSVANVLNGVMMREIGPNDSAAVFVYLCSGVMCAEWACFAIVSVLSTGRALPRVATLVGVGTALIVTLFLGVWIGTRGELENSEISFALLSMPLILASAQLPAWMARSWLRWRIQRDGAVRANGQELRIRDLLFITGYVAIVITALRWAKSFVDSRTQGGAFYAAMGIASASIVGVSLVATAVFVPLCLRQTATMRKAMIGSVCTAIALCSVVLVLMRWWSGPALSTSDMVGLIVISAVYAATVSGFLSAARRRGFVLRPERFFPDCAGISRKGRRFLLHAAHVMSILGLTADDKVPEERGCAGLVAGFTAFGCTTNILYGVLMWEFGPYDSAAVFAFLCFGVIAAEVTCLAIASVFFTGRPLPRVLTLVGVGMALIVTLFLGAWIATHGYLASSDITTALLFIPLILASAQFPAWMARSWLRWRIQRYGAALSGTHGLRIRDLLFITGYVAIVITALRWAKSIVDPTTQSGEFYAATGIVSAVIAGVSLIATAVFVPLSLRQTATMRKAMIGSVVTAIALCSVVLVPMRWWSGPALRTSGMVGLIVISAVYAATVSGFLSVARRRGFVLRRN